MVLTVNKNYPLAAKFVSAQYEAGQTDFPTLKRGCSNVFGERAKGK